MTRCQENFFTKFPITTNYRQGKDASVSYQCLPKIRDFLEETKCEGQKNFTRAVKVLHPLQTFFSKSGDINHHPITFDKQNFKQLKLRYHKIQMMSINFCRLEFSLRTSMQCKSCCLRKTWPPLIP